MSFAVKRKVGNMDLIERRAAKEAYCKNFCYQGALCPDSGFCREVEEAFDNIQPVQPEIIRCADCKYWNPYPKEPMYMDGQGRCLLNQTAYVPRYCSCPSAERREYG